jgi:hypothetical protein
MTPRLNSAPDSWGLRQIGYFWADFRCARALDGLCRLHKQLMGAIVSPHPVTTRPRAADF